MAEGGWPRVGWLGSAVAGCPGDDPTSRGGVVRLLGGGAVEWLGGRVV